MSTDVSPSLAAWTHPPDGPAEGSLSGLQDDALLRRIADEACQEAFAELYRRYSKQAYDLARTLAEDSHEAADCMQVGMLAVWHSAKKYRPANPRGWILRIVAIKTLWRKREKGRRQRMEGRLTRTASGGTETRYFGTRTDNREELACLRKHMAVLPVRDRQFLELYYTQGLSQDEIGRIFGVPQKTVSHRIQRALGILRARLKREGFSACGWKALLSRWRMEGGDSRPPNGEALRRTLAREIRPAGRAAAGSPGSPLSLRPAYSTLLLSVSGLLALSVAIGWYDRAAAHPEVPRPTTAPARIPWAASGGGPGAPFPGAGAATRHWSFEKGFPPDFHRLNGDWTWMPARQGLPAAIAGNGKSGGSVLLLPPLGHRRPLRLKIDMTQRHAGGSFTLGWTAGRSSAPYKFWQLKERGQRDRWYRAEAACYFLGRYLVVCYLDEPLSLQDFGVAYPASQIYLSNIGGEILAIEAREIAPGEVPGVLGDIPALIRGRAALKEIPARKFRNPLPP